MTTERVLPAIALPSRDGAAAQVEVAGSVARSGAHPGVGRQPGTFFSMPSRAGILIGASAAVYAVTLAAVAGFQAADDSALSARRQPYLDAIAESRAANDTLEDAVSAADHARIALAGSYGALANEVKTYEARLDALADLVAEARGSMAALPNRIDLPSVPVRAATSPGSRSSVPRPVTKTRASGG